MLVIVCVHVIIYGIKFLFVATHISFSLSAAKEWRALLESIAFELGRETVMEPALQCIVVAMDVLYAGEQVRNTHTPIHTLQANGGQMRTMMVVNDRCILTYRTHATIFKMSCFHLIIQHILTFFFCT